MLTAAVNLLFAVGMLAALVALGHLFLRLRGGLKYLWATGYGALALLLFFVGSVHSGRFDVAIHFYGPHVVCAVVTGAAFDNYFYYWLGAGDTVLLRRVWPVFAATLLILPFYLGDAGQRAQVMDAYYSGGVPGYVEWALVGALFVDQIYATRIFTTIWRFARTQSNFGIGFFVLVAATFGCVCIALTGIAIAQVANSRAIELVADCVLALGTVLGYFFLQSTIHLKLKTSVDAPRRGGPSRLKTGDVEDIGRALRDSLEGRGLFKEPDLSLAALARQVGCRPHQLSDYLNAVARKSFHEMLADYRVAESARLLERDAGANILSVCYASGFNSKSAFYVAFRKRLGCSPNEYRQSMNRAGE